MVSKSAVSLLHASKKAVASEAEVKKNIRATGFVVRSTKVMITERRDVPQVYAARKK